MPKCCDKVCEEASTKQARLLLAWSPPLAEGTPTPQLDPWPPTCEAHAGIYSLDSVNWRAVDEMATALRLPPPDREASTVVVEAFP